MISHTRNICILAKEKMDKPLSFKKTRIAPTPSGYLHLGNVLSFAITAALARKTGAKILLRIDDMDRGQQVNKLYVQDIFDTLNFLEIPWDEGPKSFLEFEREFSQIHRADLYKSALEQLRDIGAVFTCACPRTVTRQTEGGLYPGTCRNMHYALDGDARWRLNTEEKKKLLIHTWQSGKVKATLPIDMQDFIVRRKDGFPAYHLASILDDLYFGVDLVVRGEDLWPSTIAQLYLSSVLRKDAFNDIVFHHHPLLMETEERKLSKSFGATSVLYLRQQHKKPSDIYALIAVMLQLGYTPGTWEELTDNMFQK